LKSVGKHAFEKTGQWIEKANEDDSCCEVEGDLKLGRELGKVGLPGVT
jgi:hypothetical protein